MKKPVKTTLIVSIATLFLWLAGYVAFSVSALITTAERKDETSDAIIVLTGGNHRIKTGLELFAKGRTRHLFISGVNPNTTKHNIMTMWDGDTALPPCCITLGHEATTTLENAQETREWVLESGYHTVRLVTSGYHMGRAMMELRHAMPDIDIIPHPVAQEDHKPWSKKFWAITFSEYNKRLFRSVILLFTPQKAMEKETRKGSGA